MAWRQITIAITSIILVLVGFMGDVGVWHFTPLVAALPLTAAAVGLRRVRKGNVKTLLYHLVYVSPPSRNDIKRDVDVIKRTLDNAGIEYKVLIRSSRGGGSVYFEVPDSQAVREIFERTLPLVLGRVEFRLVKDVRSRPSMGEYEPLIESFLRGARGGWRSQTQQWDAEKSILLGFTSGGGPVALPIKDVTRHISIFGATGSGKTTTASAISTRLSEESIPVLILDWHNEYRHLVEEHRCRVFTPGKDGNPLLLNPLPPSSEEDVLETISVLEEALNLSPPQAYYLEDTVRRMVTAGMKVTLKTLIRNLDYRYDESYSGREARAALLRKLHLLASGPTRYMFAEKETLPDFTGGVVYIVELGHIRSISLRRLYTLILLKKVFRIYEELGVSKYVRLTIIIDEAQNVLGASESNVASRMLSEIRKYGVGLVVVTQSPSSISPQVLKNCGTKIIHSIRSNLDLKVIEESTSLGKDEVKSLPYLRRGEALIVFPDDPVPVLARIMPPASRVQHASPRSGGFSELKAF